MQKIKALIGLSLVLLWFTLILGLGVWLINEIWAVYVVAGAMILTSLGGMVLFFINLFDRG